MRDKIMTHITDEYGLLFNPWNILGSINYNGVLQVGQHLNSICNSPNDGVGYKILSLFPA